MRSLIVVLLTYLAACHGADCETHPHAIEGCAPDPYICMIDCINQGEAKCTGNGTCTEALVTDANLPTFTEMSAAKCEELCVASDAVAEITQRCRFWRWDEAAQKKTCTLMSDKQCTEYEYCSGVHCICGDHGCPEDAVPSPAKKPCKGPIIYEKEHIHWNCYRPPPPDGDGSHLSAYKSGEILVDGATCTTIQKCADWNAADVDLPMTLQVKCIDGTWAEDDSKTTGGDEADYTDVLGSDGSEAIKEPVCSGGGNKLRLEVAKIDQPGSDLICQSTPDKGDGTVDPETSYVIVAPNSCILLCDYQLGWTLESSLDPELGVSRFLCETCTDGEFPRIADEEGTEVYTQDGSVVECWPARKH